jgi:hypothetical protein
MNEVEKSQFTALIARSVDFYGPDNKNSVLVLTVAENYLKGKRPGSSAILTRFTLTPIRPMPAKQRHCWEIRKTPLTRGGMRLRPMKN